MTDISMTVAPKSDQLNSDDLIAGPRTIRITKVAASPGSAEQPISIYFEGDGGKPYKPCKSMRRVMLHVWGKDGNAYPGRSMTVFRDPAVQYGGLAVGGIRISHMSNITDPITLVLTATKQSRKPYVVKPMVEIAPQTEMPFQAILSNGKRRNFATIDDWHTWWRGVIEQASPDVLRTMRTSNGALMGEYHAEYPDIIEDLQAVITAAIDAANDIIEMDQ